MNDNSMNLVLGTLSNDAFVMVNKKLAKQIGFVEAGLLGEIIATYRMCKSNNSFFNNKGDGKEWFFLTQPYIEKNLGIKRTVFETAIKGLVKAGVIEKKRLNLPAKNYFNINADIIAQLLYNEDPIEGENEQKEAQNTPQTPVLSDCGNPANKGGENLQTRVEESCKHEWRNPATIKSIYNNNNIITISNLFEEEEKIINNIYKLLSDGMKFEIKEIQKEYGFSINDFSFIEFAKNFNQDFPDFFDAEMFARVYYEMYMQALPSITEKEAARQAKRMKEKGLSNIHDFAKYFVGGIKLNRTSENSAFNERQFEKAKEQYEANQQSEAQTPHSAKFYNWLEERESESEPVAAKSKNMFGY